MKKNNIFRRLISLTVTAAMVMTIGSSVFAANKGTLKLGQATTYSTKNKVSNVTDYYTYTPTVTGSYTLSALRTDGSNDGIVQVSTSSGFNTTIASIDGVNSPTTPKTATFNLTSGQTYYFRAGRTKGGKSNCTYSMTLTKNFATISFYGNGSTSTMPVQNVPLNQAYTLPACTMTREGYLFAGWATSATGSKVYDDKASVTPTGDMTLYAVWREPITATFNRGSQAATGTIDPIILTTPGNITLPTEGFTRTGYGLMGWQRQGVGTTTYAPGATYNLTQSTSFTAIWGPELTLNANGGQGDDVVRAYSVGAQATLSDPGFTRTGYTLLGWSTSSTATSVEYALGSKLAINAPTTLYAVWGATVAFAPNGATGTIDSVTVPLGSSITLPASGFTREGCTLTGWSTASAGTSVDYATNESYTVNGNATLTAVWGCTLSFDANGGEGSMDSIEAIAGATVNLPASTFTRTGYSTIGWSDSSSGETAVTTYTPTQSTVLYVVWTARTVYNVIFNANGGEGSMANIPLTDDVTGTIPACEFTYTGYTFLGWSTDSSAVTVEYKEGDSISVTDSDVTLYAVWSARDVYYVNFSANGGEGTMSPLALTDDVTGTIPACGFTRDGYTCIGWAIDADSETTDYVQGDSIRLTNDNLILYAVWEEGVTPGPDDPDDPDDPEVPDEPVYTPEQLREMNITHFVDNLYLVALERPYDVQGRDNWTNQLLVNGKSGSDIVYGFLNSSEFIGRNLSDEEYITLLYRIFFDREPDAEGMANWKKALAGGATRNDILRGFADSPEWLAYCARYQVNP